MCLLPAAASVWLDSPQFLSSPRAALCLSQEGRVTLTGVSRAQGQTVSLTLQWVTYHCQYSHSGSRSSLYNGSPAISSGTSLVVDLGPTGRDQTCETESLSQELQYPQNHLQSIQPHLICQSVPDLRLLILWSCAWTQEYVD